MYDPNQEFFFPVESITRSTIADFLNQAIDSDPGEWIDVIYFSGNDPRLSNPVCKAIVIKMSHLDDKDLDEDEFNRAREYMLVEYIKDTFVIS